MVMDEKRLGNTADNVPIAFILLERNPSPPKYEHVIENNPPPPSYMHSAVRLQYHNQPYITDVEQHEFRRQHDMRCASAAEDIQNDTFSTIARLPFRKRLVYYMRSWLSTLHESRLVFFAFFFVGSLVTMGLLVSFIAIPSLMKKTSL